VGCKDFPPPLFNSTLSKNPRALFLSPPVYN